MQSHMFYLVIVLIASLLASISQFIGGKFNKRVGYNKFILVLAFLVLAIPVAFRYKTGADYDSYVAIYNDIKIYGLSYIISHGMEIGYVLLNIVCYKVFNNYQAVFIITALLTNYFFYKAIVYEAKKIDLGIAIFTYGFTVYLQEYIIIRNMLAISISFYAIRYLFQNNLKKYFIYITLSCMFHYSMILFYLVGFLYKEKYRNFRKKLLILIIVTIPLLPKLIQVVSKVLILIVPRFSSYTEQFNNIGFRYNLYTIITSLPLLVFLIFYRRLKQINNHIELYIGLYVISSILFIVGAEVSLISRYVYALWISQIIIFATFIKVFNNMNNVYGKTLYKLISVILILIYGIILITFTSKLDYYYLLPYKNIFSIY